MFFETIRAFIVTEPVLTGMGVLLLLLFIYTLMLSFKLRSFCRGKSGAQLEDVVKDLNARVNTLESYARKNTATVKDIHERAQTSIRGVSVTRFDPFENAGGRQSFVTALLNEQGSGVVISGIHARDGVRVYAKPVQNFSSEHELSEEEVIAIKNAKETL